MAVLLALAVSLPSDGVAAVDEPLLAFKIDFRVSACDALASYFTAVSFTDGHMWACMLLAGSVT